jgi:hypothetical protein
MAELITNVDEVETRGILEKIAKARVDLETVRDIRKKCADAYSRQPLGNEVEMRSRVTASSVLNHVEGVHPNLMKRYLATDHRITVVGKDAKIAKALKMWVRERITDQGGFRLSNGTAKVWWARIWGPPMSGEKILTEEELMKLADDPEWSVQAVEPMPLESRPYVDLGLMQGPMGNMSMDPIIGEIQAPPTFKVKATYNELIESQPVMVPIPPEEFLVEHGKVRINDRKGCGHIRSMLAGELVRDNERLSVPGAPYYAKLKEAFASSEIADLGYERDERQQREAPLWDYAAEGANDYSTEELRKKVTVIEWADYLVQGGKLIPVIITFCNSTMIRCEENEEGIVPLCTWSPMVVSHSIYGYGIGWLHADEQNVQTVLTRAILDSVAFSIDKPRLIKQRSADLLGLQDLYPGKLVVGQEGDYSDIDVGALDFRILKAIEFLKGEGEERGPGTRYNMGTDADTLNSTATGVSLIQRAALNKVDMIALAFSELFLVDLYNKLIFLAQHNLDKPVPVTVDGETINLTRETIQGDYRARGDLGLDVDFDDRAFQKASGLMELAAKVGEKYPMLFTVEVAREHLRRVFIAAGEKDLSELLPPIPPMYQGWYPGKEQTEAQTMMAQQAMGQAQAAGQLPTTNRPGPPQLAGAGAPKPNAIPMAGSPGGPGAIQGPPAGTSTGTPDPEPGGRDYVAGQETSQPDETMMGGM